MIRNDTFNMLTAVLELRTRKAIVRELIRRGVIERPVAPRKIDSLGPAADHRSPGTVGPARAGQVRPACGW
jgi:hypothetical protein